MKVRDRSENSLEQQEKAANRLRMQGFFSFKDGKIEGPVELKDAFKKTLETEPHSQSLPQKERDPDSMVIKRKVAEYEVETHQAIFEFKSSVESSIERLAKLGAMKEPDLAAAKELAHQASAMRSRSPIQNAPSHIESTKSQIIVNKKPNLFEDLPQINFELEDFPSDFIANRQEALQAAPEVDLSKIEPPLESVKIEVALPPIKMNPLIVAPSYLTLRGRLRLGVLRSIGIGSAVKFFLTLGCNMLLWLHEAQNEVVWHKAAQWRKLAWYQIMLGLIPILSTFNYIALARQIQDIERQNGYLKTKVYLACFLAVFPPLAAMYLQSSLNRHWRLHVQNFS